VELKLQYLYSEDFITIRASIVNAFPEHMPHENFADITKVGSFQELLLADPYFSPGAHQDILLGISHYNLSFLPDVVLSQDKGYKIALTIFGWAIGETFMSSISGNAASSTCSKMAPAHNKV